MHLLRLPESKTDHARQVAAIYCLARYMLAIAGEPHPKTLLCVEYIGKMIHECDDEHKLNAIDAARECKEPMTERLVNLALSMIALYSENKIHPREFWSLMPIESVEQPNQPPPNMPAQGGDDAAPDKMPDINDGHKAPVPVTVGRVFPNGVAPDFPRSYDADRNDNLARLARMGGVPLRCQMGEISPEVMDIVKTTQVLPTGHRLEMKVNFAKRTAEYGLWAPVSFPGQQPLVHGHMLLPEGASLDQKFFQVTAQSILGGVVANLEKTFRLYQVAPNNVETG